MEVFFLLQYLDEFTLYNIKIFVFVYRLFLSVKSSLNLDSYILSLNDSKYKIKTLCQGCQWMYHFSITTYEEVWKNGSQTCSIIFLRTTTKVKTRLSPFNFGDRLNVSSFSLTKWKIFYNNQKWIMPQVMCYAY